MKLLNENLWYCDVCKEHVNATKKVDIYKAPEYLILHLNRNEEKKDYTMINFPLEGLDMTEYVINQQVNIENINMDEEQKEGEKKKLLYDCYAVVNHDVKENVYTAIVQNFKDH